MPSEEVPTPADAGVDGATQSSIEALVARRVQDDLLPALRDKLTAFFSGVDGTRGLTDAVTRALHTSLAEKFETPE
jgi:hypothetical protein